MKGKGIADGAHRAKAIVSDHLVDEDSAVSLEDRKINGLADLIGEVDEEGMEV